MGLTLKDKLANKQEIILSIRTTSSLVQVRSERVVRTFGSRATDLYSIRAAGLYS